MSRLALVASVLLALPACSPPASPTAGPSVREAAPAVVLPTADGPVDLATLAGRPVVLHFAAADDAAAWAALADALGDLEAAGAAVVAVSVDGAEDEAARAFGYDGSVLAVVVDGKGTVRGRATPRSGDDLFALAGPVLAEADIAATVSWRGPETLDALVAAGGIVIDIDEIGDPGLNANLHIAADTLAAQDLPADLGTPLAFVGDDAAEVAGRVTRWVYAAVFVADAEGLLTAVEPEPLPRPDRPARTGGVRG